MVETGGENSALMRQNWCHDSGKSALRFDGDDKSGTSNGEMSRNVAWNISAMVIKGNKHNITRNTAFDGSDIGSSLAPASYPGFQNATSRLDYCTHSATV